PWPGFPSDLMSIALVVATDSQDRSYHSIFAAGLMLFLIMAGLTMVIRGLAMRIGKGKERHDSAA
ncbi:MAG TPA: hypothetical protein PLR71_09570, partial [Deltaproteobacteria bacterium]|nr:hypothetical protein [Deltaproteobacteria bacterium]